METNYPKAYWAFLREIKTQSIYIEEYIANISNINIYINIIIAITSSSSIAGWYIWDDLKILWGIIIGLSQVIIIIRPFLNIDTRIKALYTIAPKLSELVLETEEHWFDIAEGKLTIEEINSLRIGLLRKVSTETNKAFKNINIPEKKKILKRSEIIADKYLRKYYHPD